MNIIGLGHRKRTGKNLLGELLIQQGDQIGRKVATLSFASPLKRVANELFGWGGMRDEKYYEEHAEEREKLLPALTKTPRQVMIEIGLKVREIHPDTWAMVALDAAEELSEYGYDTVVITDVRFPNEFALLKEQGATLIKVVRPSIPDSNDAADSALAKCEDWDRVVINDKDIPYLEGVARSIMEDLWKTPNKY
jgi:hypothetical protein